MIGSCGLLDAVGNCRFSGRGGDRGWGGVVMDASGEQEPLRGSSEGAWQKAASAPASASAAVAVAVAPKELFALTGLLGLEAETDPCPLEAKGSFLTVCMGGVPGLWIPAFPTA